MKVTPIAAPLPGEHLATTAPVMAPETPIDWRQRLNFWAGRALTAEALDLEQEHRAAQLARLGRIGTAGVVTGLEVALEAPATAPENLATAGHFVHLLPGYGITVSGEDVTIPRALRIPLDQIPVHYVRKIAEGEESNPTPDEVVVRTPLEGGGAILEVDDFTPGFLPWAAALVARPAEFGAFENIDPTDPCELDPSLDAFADERRLDGMVLRLFELPREWQDDPLLADPGDARWRNRLAQMIFRAEGRESARHSLRYLASQEVGRRWDSTLAERMIFPWELFGLPVALFGTEVIPGEARSFFLDRAAVVRPGGRNRARSRPTSFLATEENDETLHPPGGGAPALWRARVDQFAEQLSRFSDLPANEQAAHFQFLPPAGLLPRNALDFLTTEEAILLPSSSPGASPDRAAVSHFFPASIALEAAPMPLEDLDAELAGSAPLAPFDFEAGDDFARILMPVPQRVFDPRLLVVEEEDAFFASEVARLTAVRQDRRQRRDSQQGWLVQLEGLLAGEQPPQAQPALEPGQFEPEPVEGNSQLPAAAYLSPADTPGPWEINAKLAGTTLTPTTVLFVRLRLDFDHPPSRVEMRWQRGDGEVFAHVWTEPSGPFAERLDSEGNPVAMSLAQFYTVTAGELGATGDPLTSFTLHLEDGRVALAEVGELRSTSSARSGFFGLARTSGFAAVPLQWWKAADEQQPVTFLGGDWEKIPVEHLGAPFEELSEPTVTGDLPWEARVDEVSSAVNPEAATPRPDPVSVETDGLEKALSVLEAEANEADDFVDANFLRAQTNLYRIRKLILGESAAQKLLINPAISVIAEQQTAAASAEQLHNYLAAAKTSGQIVDRVKIQDALGITRAAQPAPAPPQNTRIFPGELIKKVNPLAAAASSSILFKVESTPPARGASRAPGTLQTFSPLLAAALRKPASPIKFSTEKIVFTLDPPASRFSLSDPVRLPPLAGVYGQLPESGPVLPPRGLSIGKRFEEPPSTENLAYARSALSTLVEQLPKLRLPLLDEKVRALGGDDIALLDLQGRTAPAASSEGARSTAANRLLDASRVTIGDLDEADVTLAALDLIEIKSAILRTIEKVIQQRRALIDRGRETLAAIRTSAAVTAARASDLNGSLAEARHDVNVGRALRQEEQGRVAGINTQRDAVLREEVKFLAYVRPRTVDPVRRVAPGWKLESSDALAPVPACLRLHDQPPDALRAYVQLLQQAPVRWFPEIATRLKELDTREKLTELLAATQHSAYLFSAQQRVAFAQQVTQVAPQNTLLSAFARVQPSRIQAASLQLHFAPAISWSDLHRQAQDNSSLGDIITGRHGNPALAKAAAGLLDQIESVGACLHAEFAAVAAATRLLWVERYSQFDQPAPLRDLTVLPGYGSLDRAARRRFQAFVDWLFQRVDDNAADAFSLINDLVRICLLLASQAPVKSLIAGHVPRPLPVRPGLLFPVRPFHPSLVKVGMEVHIWQADKLVAQARVEDMGDGEVSARMVKLHSDATTLDETMKVQFVPAALGISRALSMR